MGGQAVVLPRIRGWHPKWPDRRTVYWALVFTVVLGFLAHASIQVMRGHPGWVFNAMLWTTNFLFDRHHYLAEKRKAKSSNASLPPIRWHQWLWVACAVPVLTFEWLLLLNA